MVRTVVVVANKDFKRFKETFESVFKGFVPFDEVIILCDFKDEVFESYFKGLLFNNIRVVRRNFEEFIESNEAVVIVLGL